MTGKGRMLAESVVRAYSLAEMALSLQNQDVYPQCLV